MKKGTSKTPMIGVILVFILILSFYGGATFYIAGRFYQGITLFSSNINVVIYVCIFVFLALSIMMRFMPIPYSIKRFIDTIGSYWMGLFVYLLITFLATDIIIFLGRAATIIPSPVPQGIRFWSFLIVILVTAGLMIYGKYNAVQIRHVSYEIDLKDSSLTEELNIVMIADLHLGVTDGEKKLPQIIHGINDLKPDIVCITGDIFNDDIYLIRNHTAVMDSFRSIEAKFGVYACLGNHDGGRTYNEMVSFLEQSNITLLNDEHVIIDERFILIGRLDARPIGGYGNLERTDIADVVSSIDSDLPLIVMDHDPSHIKEYGNKFDLLLFGHTHKGQLFPVNLITSAIYITNYGHYQKEPDSPHIVVTSGVSTWGTPVRIGTKNEIVSILLR